MCKLLLVNPACAIGGSRRKASEHWLERYEHTAPLNTMIQERLSNLTVLNSLKQRTDKSALPTQQINLLFVTIKSAPSLLPPTECKRGSHRPPHLKNCSACPDKNGKFSRCSSKQHLLKKATFEIYSLAFKRFCLGELQISGSRFYTFFLSQVSELITTIAICILGTRVHVKILQK